MDAAPDSLAPRLTSEMLSAIVRVPLAAALHVCWRSRSSPCSAARWRLPVAGYARDLADGLADFLDREHRFLSRFLHSRNIDGNLVGRLHRLARQRFHLGGDNGKPRPASPARAGLMVALSASRLVCSAMAVISLTTSPILLRRHRQLVDTRIGRFGLRTAAAQWLDPGTCRPISSLTEAESSSVAAATDRNVGRRLFGRAGDLA